MPNPTSSRRVCPEGHVYEKASSCPVCPVCEAARQVPPGVLTLVAAPARRALERAGVATFSDLARFSEAELLALHGFGPSSLPPLRRGLADNGLAFRVE